MCVQCTPRRAQTQPKNNYIIYSPRSLVRLTPAQFPTDLFSILRLYLLGNYMGQNSAVEITGGFYQVGDAHQGFYQISKTKNISLVVKTVCKIVFSLHCGIS